MSIPKLIYDTIRTCLPFKMFQTVSNKLHEHSHTGIKITYNTFSQYYYIPYLEKSYLFLYMTVLNVNEVITPI